MGLDTAPGVVGSVSGGVSSREQLRDGPAAETPLPLADEFCATPWSPTGVGPGACGGPRFGIR